MNQINVYTMKFFLICVISLALNNFCYAQCTQAANLQLQSNIPTPNVLTNHNMTARRDTSLSKPYLYIAGKEQGLVIYNISNIVSPVLTASVLPSSLLNLHVMSLTQAGNYLYLALGDHFNSGSQASGMAIVDISTPSMPVVTDTYSYTNTSGAGHVEVEGNYAYLSAMQNGIIVLDVTNKSSIQFVSVFKPSIHFPKVNPNSSELQKINVRQVIAKNNVLYVCYDAGGIRIVNAVNKSNLLETGQYSNPVLNTRPRAYNNLVLNDSLVYVAADYCGMEILNIKDTSNVSMVGWWNPWNCQSTSNTWFNSPGHANEIEFDSNCKLVFISTGRSDMHVVNVSNPALPDSCTRFGNTTDSLATWGLGHFKDQIYLAYISTWPFYIPFPGKWSGIKIITYDNTCSTGIKNLNLLETISLYPNPTNGEISIELRSVFKNAYVEVYNSLGQLLINRKITERLTRLGLDTYPIGLYNVKLMVDSEFQTVKILKID